MVCCCCCSVAKSCPTLLWPHGLWPARLLCPWDSPGKNTGVGCHFFLHWIFPTQSLLHCRQILYHLRLPLASPLPNFFFASRQRKLLVIKDSFGYTLPTWIIQDNLPILRFLNINYTYKFPSARQKGKYSWIPGIRAWISLGEASLVDQR